MKQELVIDLGSKKTVILKKDSGIVIKEPSVIITSTEGNTLRLIASGSEAMSRIGKTNSNEQVIFPIEQGVIVNDRACQIMLKDYLSRVIPKSVFKQKVTAIVVISLGLTSVEKRSIEDICIKAGVNEVTLVETPLAVAGAIEEGQAMMIEIGNDKTEIAIVNENGILAGCTVDIGGDTINDAITDYIAAKYRVIVHYNTTEKIKKTIATLSENDMTQVAVNGRGVVDGELKNIKLSAVEIRESFVDVVDKLAKIIEDITLMIPESMAMAIANRGLYFCGGGAMLPGMGEYMSKKLMMKCRIMSHADEIAALGGSKYIYNRELLNKLLNVSNLS